MLPIVPVMIGIPMFNPCLVHKEIFILNIFKSPSPDPLHLAVLTGLSRLI